MRLLNTVWLLIIVGLLSACTKVPEMSPETAAQLFAEQKAVIIDVREQEEWDEQHIEGAILIPLGEVESRMAEFAQYKDTTIIMQCRSGRRSGESSKTLIQAGYENVYNLKGGIIAWNEANLETVKGAPK